MGVCSSKKKKEFRPGEKGVLQAELEEIEALQKVDQEPPKAEENPQGIEKDDNPDKAKDIDDKEGQSKPIAKQIAVNENIEAQTKAADLKDKNDSSKTKLDESKP